MNAWNSSLQTPGVSLYLPHWSFGEPSASGPWNALIRFCTPAGVTCVAPTSFRNRTVVSTCENETMNHGSGACLTAPYFLTTAM